MDISNPYKLFEALDLLPTATEKEVKQAFRKLALLYHPDRGTQRDVEKMKIVNIAYAEIMSEKLYRPPRIGSSEVKKEPWYEFTQPWKPTPEEFQQFNDECIAAYVERFDDDIRLSVPDFDDLAEVEQEKLRRQYRVWSNRGKKKSFEPSSPTSAPTKEVSATLTPRQRYSRQRNLLLEYFDIMLVVTVVLLVALALFLSIIEPESMGVWFLCFVVLTLCAPVGWKDSTEY